MQKKIKVFTQSICFLHKCFNLEVSPLHLELTEISCLLELNRICVCQCRSNSPKKCLTTFLGRKVPVSLAVLTVNIAKGKSGTSSQAASAVS